MGEGRFPRSVGHVRDLREVVCVAGLCVVTARVFFFFSFLFFFFVSVFFFLFSLTKMSELRGRWWGSLGKLSSPVREDLGELSALAGELGRPSGEVGAAEADASTTTRTHTRESLRQRQRQLRK